MSSFSGICKFNHDGRHSATNPWNFLQHFCTADARRKQKQPATWEPPPGYALLCSIRCNIPIDADTIKQQDKANELKDYTIAAAREIQQIGEDQRKSLLESLKPRLETLRQEIEQTGMLEAAMRNQRLIESAIKDEEEERDKETKMVSNTAAESTKLLDLGPFWDQIMRRIFF